MAVRIHTTLRINLTGKAPAGETDGERLRSAVEMAVFAEQHGFSIEDAFIFLSVACDAGVAQACKPAEGFGTIARFSIPKDRKSTRLNSSH